MDGRGRELGRVKLVRYNRELKARWSDRNLTGILLSRDIKVEAGATYVRHVPISTTASRYNRACYMNVKNTPGSQLDMYLHIAVLCAATIIGLAQSSPIMIDAEHDTVNSAQAALIACPQLSVKCVAEGDWMHPIGQLGKRRK